MRLTLIQSACALGLVCAVSTACNKSNDRPTVSAAEQRRIDERRAEERHAEERRAEEHDQSLRLASTTAPTAAASSRMEVISKGIR